MTICHVLSILCVSGKKKKKYRMEYISFEVFILEVS
jgi:hypothetical protein